MGSSFRHFWKQLTRKHETRTEKLEYRKTEKWTDLFSIGQFCTVMISSSSALFLVRIGCRLLYGFSWSFVLSSGSIMIDMIAFFISGRFGHKLYYWFSLFWYNTRKHRGVYKRDAERKRVKEILEICGYLRDNPASSQALDVMKPRYEAPCTQFKFSYKHTLGTIYYAYTIDIHSGHFLSPRSLHK